MQATDGNFYGTTNEGGTNSNGTVFKITPSGVLTTLHNFNGTDGSGPIVGLVQATDGNLYGTAQLGRVNNNGTIFEITLTGVFTTLHSFIGTDGNLPQGTLLQATDGNFYRTTTSGGAINNGTFFSLSIGLGPFVKTLPDAASVGTAVEILGTNLAGATSVTFNGTAASFVVFSASNISTTVPVNASTGNVQVMTPAAHYPATSCFE